MAATVNDATGSACGIGRSDSQDKFILLIMNDKRECLPLDQPRRKVLFRKV